MELNRKILVKEERNQHMYDKKEGIRKNLTIMGTIRSF